MTETNDARPSGGEQQIKTDGGHDALDYECPECGHPQGEMELIDNNGNCEVCGATVEETPI